MRDRDSILLQEAYQACNKIIEEMPNIIPIPRRKWGDENSIRDWARPVKGKERKRETHEKPTGYFKLFPIQEYDRRGGYFDTKPPYVNLTGKIYIDGFIDTSGEKAIFKTNDDEVESLISGTKIETNLVKPIKFDWVEGGENQRGKYIATVEKSSDHFYAVKVVFKNPVQLATNPDKASEPRLRPRSTGNLSFGNEIGKIQIKNKQRYTHPLYDVITIS